MIVQSIKKRIFSIPQKIPSFCGILTYSNFCFLYTTFYDIFNMLLPSIWQQKRGMLVLDIFISFLISVMAGIACHYICKWLDRNK
ncbi:hypothetical protein DW776_16460 [Ruminococcus sp. AM30-15AC]|nr:hypothetical protein DW776_16460 [Ruminococcus sp. AM30-15AC]